MTLASEGNHQITAHKVILAASSPFFMEILRSSKHSHPLIYMRGIKTKDIAAIVDFIYHGEAKIHQDDLDAFLALAEELKLKGLTNNKSEEAMYQEVREDISIDDVVGKKKNSLRQTLTDSYDEQRGINSTLEAISSDTIVPAESPRNVVMKFDSELGNEVLDKMHN